MKRKIVTCVAAVIAIAAVSLEGAYCSSTSNGGTIDLVQFPDSGYPYPASLHSADFKLLADLYALLDYQHALSSGGEIFVAKFRYAFVKSC